MALGLSQYYIFTARWWPKEVMIMTCNIFLKLINQIHLELCLLCVVFFGKWITLKIRVQGGGESLQQL